MTNWNSSLKSFRTYLRLERALSDHSIEAYIHDTDKLVQYLNLDVNNSDVNAATMSPKDITTTHIQKFLNWLMELGLEASSQARILAGLKAFYKFLLIEDMIDHDPTALVEGPKKQSYLPSVLSIHEIQAMLDIIDLSTPQGHRNRAMLETLYACGLRVSELIDLRITNLFFQDGFIKVIGKSDKERIVPIGEEAQKHILLYLQQVRVVQKVKNGQENYVFLNRNGSKLTRVMVFLIIKEVAAAANIVKNVSPHTFRHSFATHLVEGGADLKAVQDMLGHESITTTEIYTHIDTAYLRETLTLYHPRNKRK
jgi:integrase/recombinase XerD